jgi:hypothetical protein
MANPSKIVLSGSTDGKPIPVAATSTPGTTIHTAGATGRDDLYLWASNTDTAAHTLTLEWGGTSDPGDLLVKAYSIAANSAAVPVALGQPMQNSKVVKAFADSASKVNITGYVIREV